jgi:hypothetical protein
MARVIVVRVLLARCVDLLVKSNHGSGQEARWGTGLAALVENRFVVGLGCIFGGLFGRGR